MAIRSTSSVEILENRPAEQAGAWLPVGDGIVEASDACPERAGPFRDVADLM
jgi:hypothetical protein